jgi:hypothetical protein
VAANVTRLIPRDELVGDIQATAKDIRIRLEFSHVTNAAFMGLVRSGFVHVHKF